MLTGEAPEVNPEVAERLRDYGHDDFVSYVVWACERALERGLLPHTNLGVLSTRRPRPPARGDRVAGADARVDLERLMETVHAGSPTKHPAAGWQTIEAAGELRIPFTSGILVGIGETRGRAHRLARGAGRGPRPSRPPPGGDPAELRSAPELLRARGGRDRRRVGAPAMGRGTASPLGGEQPLPDVGDADHARRHGGLVAECRRLMPDVGIQIPPNLSDWWVDLVEAGATDLGGLSANGDHISPEQAFPSPHQVRKRLAPRGYALTERLCAYPQYLEPGVDRAGRARRGQAQVLELHPAPRLGSAQERDDRPRARAAGDRTRARAARRCARRS